MPAHPSSHVSGSSGGLSASGSRGEGGPSSDPPTAEAIWFARRPLGERPCATGDLPAIAPYRLLDAWRGIAALWVIAVHACLPYVLNGHQYLLHNPVYFVGVWGQLGVTMFFVISGYCITGAAYSSIAARKTLTNFCLDRVRRIYPPYLAALFVALAVLGGTALLQRWHILETYRSPRPPLGLDWAYWLSNLTLTQLPARQSCLLVIAWSLCYEVAFYVVVAFLLALGSWWARGQSAGRLRTLLVGIGTFTCGSLVWGCIAPTTCWFPLKLWYQFGLGALLFLWFAADATAPGYKARSDRALSRVLTMAAIVLTAIYGVTRADVLDPTQSELGHPSSRVQVVTALFFLGVLYALRARDARLLKHRACATLAHVGAFSYSLYLIHLPLLPFVDAGLRRCGFTEDWYLVPFVLQILLAIVAGRGFFLLVEQRFISGRQVRRLASE